MAEVRLKAKAKSIANFKRGSDLLTYQIYIYIKNIFAVKISVKIY